MTGNKRKNYRLDEECMGVIKEAQAEQQFATETKALRHIIMEYRRFKDEAAKETELDVVATKIANKVKRELDPVLRQIRIAMSETERRT